MSPSRTIVKKGGSTPSAAISGKPRPRIPSNLPAIKETEPSLVISPKVTPGTGVEPMVSVSFDRIPSHEPDPYARTSLVPFWTYVDDAELSYFLWRRQAIDLHCVDGIQRLDEPVSKITLNVWAGVPRPMGP